MTMNFDELMNSRVIKRNSALVDCVIKAIGGLTKAQVLMREIDNKLCLKVVDISTEAKRDEIKSMLDEQFCESLMFVKATKTTLVYALPIVKGVA